MVGKFDWKLLAIIIVMSLVTGGVIGYFFGKGNIETVTVIEKQVKYFPGKRIVGTIKDLDPVRVEIPSIPDLLVYRDTIIIDSVVYVNKVDSFTILREYLTKRYYDETLFDIDTIGKCKITFQVYKNRASNLNYEFTPVYKTIEEKVTEIKKPRDMFVTGGMGLIINGGLTGQVAFFDKKFGIGYQYTNFNKESYHGVNLFYKINF